MLLKRKEYNWKKKIFGIRTWIKISFWAQVNAKQNVYLNSNVYSNDKNYFLSVNLKV